MKASNYIKIRKGHIDAQLDVFFFEKDGVFFAYAPALDLIGYDRTIEGSKSSFEVIVEDYFEYGIKRGTLEKDLEKHGWVKERTAEFEIPNIWTILANNKNVQDLSRGDFMKRSVPFKHEVAYC